MSASKTITEGPLAGTTTGTWRIDPMHSSVTFSVRHLMGKVRGRFADVEGQVVLRPDLGDAAVRAAIATTSVDTGTPMRDDDLRSVNFLDSERFPAIEFESTSIAGDDQGLTLTGELTIRDIAREVTIDVDFLGRDDTGLQGESRLGFAGRTTVRRSDFGVGETPVRGSKVVVGDVVTIELDIQAYLDA